MERNRLGAGARLSVVWQAGQAESTLDTVEHVSSYARSLVEALSMAGWQPKRIEVGLRALPGIVELDVRGEVPRLDQASFAKLASVAIAACNLWAALDDDAEIRLRARLLPVEVEAEAPKAVAVITEPAPALPRPEPALVAAAAAETTRTPSLWNTVRLAEPASAAVVETPGPATPAPPAPTATAPASAEPADRPRLATRVIVALVFGGLLGLFGLPRLSAEFILPGPAPAAQPLPTPAPLITTIPEGIVAATLAPTTPPVPTATSAPTAVPTTAPRARPTTNAAAAPDPARVLFAQRFVSPLDGWPHNPQGTAWFADGTYQMMAREPGRFVAIGTPIDKPVGDVMMSARFRKIGGPDGGGYGFIVRNQGSNLDGDSQSGSYIVVEVGDRGDVGIWQRDNARWVDIMPWTHSNAVKTGDLANELSVTTQGNRLKFVVNGVEVANMTNASLPSDGGVGIFVGGDLNEVSLEWLIVETPDSLLAR